MTSLDGESKQLVVDANVARSAGGVSASNPTSKHSRDLLSAILRICHRIVMIASREIEEIRPVVWSNPDQQFDQTRDWLESGAGYKEEWTLGHRL
jgi:hypothetical protein